MVTRPATSSTIVSNLKALRLKKQLKTQKISLAIAIAQSLQIFRFPVIRSTTSLKNHSLLKSSLFYRKALKNELINFSPTKLFPIFTDKPIRKYKKHKTTQKITKSYIIISKFNLNSLKFTNYSKSKGKTLFQI